MKFDGFLALYQEGKDDDGDDEDSRRLPAMSAGEALKRQDLAVTQHFTEPPPRFSEASLVKRMEELGIGRPSTYASILQVLKDRGYVKLEKKRLHGEDKGRVVVAFLENFFARYVEYDFTAALEEQLDRISNNEISWQQVLKEFWTGFIGAVNDIKDLRVSEVLDALDDMLGPHIYPPRADGGDVRQCPTCGTGKLNLKAGKFGAFVGCSNYPECRYTRPLAADCEASADRVLGKDPETDLDVTVKAGRFGPYIQLGEQKDYAEGEKPRRAGIPKNMSPGDMELELALKLLSLPREIGKHPETGEPITAGIGRFGPFVRHEKTYASLEAGDEVFDIGLNRAVTLIAEKIAKGPSGRRFGADPGKPLGEHPSLGGVAVKNGRYGAYVTAGGVNATIPSDKTPETITLAEAIALIDERAAKGGGKPKRGAEEGCAEEGSRQDCRQGGRSRRAKACQEGGSEEGRGEAEIGSRQQGARAGRIRRQDIGGEARHCIQNACEEERGQGPGISEEKTRQWFSEPGRHRRLHPCESGQDRHAGNRPRVRPEECRPRRAEAHPARTRRRRRRSPSAAGRSTSPPPCPRPWSPTSPAATPTANCSPRPPNGTGGKRRPRRKSAFTCRAVRSRAPPPASATAR